MWINENLNQVDSVFLCKFESDLILLSLYRVQTLTSSTNLRTPCPAGSTSLWSLMTACPCHQRSTCHIDPLWTSPILNCQGPKSLLGCYVAVSVSPPSLRTWRPPQRCRRSRGMSLTLSCQAARTPITNRTQRPGLFGRQPYVPSSVTSFLLP